MELDIDDALNIRCCSYDRSECTNMNLVRAHAHLPQLMKSCTLENLSVKRPTEFGISSEYLMVISHFRSSKICLRTLRIIKIMCAS